MNTNGLTLAVAAVLALTVSAGGVAATDHVYSLSDDTSDELPDEYDLTVVDPDDRLSDDQVETAIALAWQHDDVQAEFGESEAYDVTVQATDGLDDVTVVIEGDAGEVAGADVDLEEEAVTDVLSSDRVKSADATDTADLDGTTELDDGTVSITLQDDGGTIAFSEDEVDVDIVVMSLVNAAIDVADEDGLLSDGETALLEDLVRNDTDVNRHVNDLLDRENETGDVEWTLTVREHEGDLFAPADEPVLEAELTYDGTADAVSVYVNLDDEEIVEVVPVRALDLTDAENVNIDEEDVTVVEDDEHETDDE